jgi:hypothetical protein
MAFEGAQMVPVYDMNKSDGDGFMGGGAGWMWVVMLFFLLAWGGGFGGFGGGANGAVNTLTNEFLYTNLNNTIDRGFNQLANQNFGIQKDICESTGALQMGLCQGFNQTNAAIAESRFAAQQCCCETNRNIDAVRAENYKNTCEITTAIHAEAEATRALINSNTMQNLRDKLADRDRELQTANFQLSQQAQSANIIGTLRPFPQPAYITCSPYQAVGYYGNGCGYGCNNGCGC